MMSKEELARVTDPGLIDLAGMIRSWDVKLTNKAQWQVAGEQMPDDAGRLVREIRNAEVYSGIGFYARPARSGSPEAIVAFLSADANSPTVVAARDEKTRTTVVGGLGEGETAVYNDRAVIVVKADGTVEIRLANGTAIPLATKLDLQILRQAMDNAVIAVGSGGAKSIGLAADIAATAACAALTPPRTPDSPAWPIGTAQLKAQ